MAPWGPAELGSDGGERSGRKTRERELCWEHGARLVEDDPEPSLRARESEARARSPR